MPTYEYLCEKCDNEFEVEQRITDDPIKSCPACRSRKVKRLISRTSFVLKGGGWYSDLYASGGGKSEDAGGDKQGEAASSGESKSESTSGDKPDKGGPKGGKKAGKKGGKGAKAAA